jgi:hypothetical protein
MSDRSVLFAAATNSGGYNVSLFHRCGIGQFLILYPVPCHPGLQVLEPDAYVLS